MFREWQFSENILCLAVPLLLILYNVIHYKNILHKQFVLQKKWVLRKLRSGYSYFLSHRRNFCWSSSTCVCFMRISSWHRQQTSMNCCWHRVEMICYRNKPFSLPLTKLHSIEFQAHPPLMKTSVSLHVLFHFYTEMILEYFRAKEIDDMLN